MLSAWLFYQQREGSGYRFAVVDVTEKDRPDEEVLNYLAHELVLAHGNPERIRAESSIFLEDLGEVGLEGMQEYIENTFLPDKDRVSVRVGNFGEVLAACMLITFEGFWLPLYKLRFREKKDWSMRLTDLCLIRMDRAPRPLVCYGEVKTKSTGCDRRLGVKGHESLAKDDALSNPEILHFICTWLYEKGMYEEAMFFSRIRLGKIDYDRRHDLFLVHTDQTWDPEILDNLDECELDSRLVDFSVKVVLIADLRQVIDETYERVGTAGAEIVDG